jgi:hypothetical protein
VGCTFVQTIGWKWITCTQEQKEEPGLGRIYNFSIVTATTEKRPVTRGAHDQRHAVEEPCELETLKHGFEAEPGGRPPGLGSADRRMLHSGRDAGSDDEADCSR